MLNGFNDSSWFSGAALLFAPPQRAYSLPEPVNTILPHPTNVVTYYFRTRFTPPSGTTLSALQFSHVVDDDQMLIISEQGMIIRFPVAGVRSMGRNTQGVRLIHIEEGDKVVAAMKIVDKEQPEDQTEEAVDGAEAPGEPDSVAPPDDDTVH